MICDSCGNDMTDDGHFASKYNGKEMVHWICTCGYTAVAPYKQKGE